MQYSQRDICVFEVVHQVLGTFEIRRTSELEVNETVVVRGEYTPQNGYSKAVIKVNENLIDYDVVKETIIHELLHHVFQTEIDRLSEENIITCLAPLLPFIVKSASELAAIILGKGVQDGHVVEELRG